MQSMRFNWKQRISPVCRDCSRFLGDAKNFPIKQRNVSFQLMANKLHNRRGSFENIFYYYYANCITFIEIFEKLYGNVFH